MNYLQQCGSRQASAFGGSGNNDNAAAGYLNGNNSVANSNDNYSASFALPINVPSGTKLFLLEGCYTRLDSMTNKVEKIATTKYSQKDLGLESRFCLQGNCIKEIDISVAGLEYISLVKDVVFIDTACKYQITEIEARQHPEKGMKTVCKHKRLRNIKAFILNKKIIKEAIFECEQDKKRTPSLIWCMNHVDITTEEIYGELKNETYVPKPYRFKTIINKDGKKRHLAILGFYDRCVQQVLKKVIENKLRALEPRNVYGNLPERGMLSNTARYCMYSQMKHDFHVRPNGYGLKIDIHHCYESISVEQITDAVFKYVTDAFVRRLIIRMFKHIKHLPIGDPLSGLYVNLILLKWHRFLLENRHDLFDKAYFFCDDQLIIGNNKKALHQLCQEAKIWFPKNLGLHLKKNYQIYRLKDGITFCGVKVTPNKIIPRRKVKQRAIQVKDNPKSLVSYKGIFDKTNSAHLSKLLDMQSLPAKIREQNKHGQSNSRF